MNIRPFQATDSEYHAITAIQALLEPEKQLTIPFLHQEDENFATPSHTADAKLRQHLRFVQSSMRKRTIIVSSIIYHEVPIENHQAKCSSIYKFCIDSWA